MQKGQKPAPGRHTGIAIPAVREKLCVPEYSILTPTSSEGYSPTVYFKPQEVWEIKGAE